MTQIAIIGATGFIGRELVGEILRQGGRPLAITRNIGKGRKILGDQVEIREWDGRSPEKLGELLNGVSGIINLAGENIASGYWTGKKKRQLSDSRVKTGQVLTEAILGMEDRPGFLLQGSATGYYGTRVFHPIGEEQAAGKGFLARLTSEWEQSVKSIGEAGVRTVYLRTGIVLGRSGGMLDKFLTSFRLYAGAIPGSGKQYIPWIHMSDHVRAVAFLAQNSELSGAFNLTSPEPVKMKEFARAIGRTTGRPTWLSIPAPVISAVLGEMGRETILSSQNVIPRRLTQAGFGFRFEQLQPALEDLLGKK